MKREHVKKGTTRQKGAEYSRCDKVICAVSALAQTKDRCFRSDSRPMSVIRTRSHHAVR
jgi:hypothetical protein